MRLKHKSGFTLIELLVVVAIIGILASVGVVAYNGYTSAAKINATKQAYKMAEKKLNSVIAACKNGIGLKMLYSGRECTTTLNGDQAAWETYNHMTRAYNKNPYDSSVKATEWNQSDGIAYCPPKKPPKGQVKIGYGEKGNINYCRMGGGNMSCIYANIGNKDGSDEYLYKEFNLCDF